MLAPMIPEGKTMKNKAFCIMFLATIPAAATAQPASTSMAQCAGVYDSMTRLMPSIDRQEALARAASQYLRAARTQAAREGIAQPEKTTDATYRETRDTWERKGARVVFSQEFRDWTTYCRSFAENRGIELGL